MRRLRAFLFRLVQEIPFKLTQGFAGVLSLPASSLGSLLLPTQVLPPDGLYSPPSKSLHFLPRPLVA